MLLLVVVFEMPVDTRRVNGPATTFPLSTFLTKEEETPLLDYEDVRGDGRKCDEVRPIFLKAGKSFKT